MNIAHIVTTSRLVITMGNVQRRDTLQHFLSDSGLIIFDGPPVCAESLLKAFRFSNDLQFAVMDTQHSMSRSCPPISHTGRWTSWYTHSLSLFLLCIADQTGNSMPDSKDVNLPIYDKVKVYKLFCVQYEALEKKTLPAKATSTPSGKSLWITSKFDE